MAKTYSGKGIFSFLDDLFVKKTSWDTFTQEEQKAFTPYMINRWISMEPEYIGIINFCQRFTIGLLKPREVYKLYADLFPKSKIYVKYIKSTAEKEDKISSELVKFMAQKNFWSEYETEQNLMMAFTKPSGVREVIDYLLLFGFTDKEIKSKFKLK